MQLVYEALVTDGEFPYEPSYLVVYRIEEKANGLELGQFRWHIEDGATAFHFTPNAANLAKVRKRK